MAKAKKATTKSKGPANPSAERERMLGMWGKMNAILGGTETMRMAGQTYMPAHAGEEDARYKERRWGATLWNQTEITLGGWVGRPFRTPLKLNDDVPEQITELAQDIDQQGTNMDTFARAWFRSGVAKAFSHVLVEKPVLAQRVDGAPLTLADVQAQKPRPYWLLIEPEAIIAARSMVVDGEEMLTHLRIHEVTQEQDDEDEFAEVTVERIRVYDLRAKEDNTTGVFVRIYKNNPKRSDEDAWDIEVNEFEIDIDRIPLVTFYSDRQGFLLGKSPLQDLCDLNIKHWCSQSDQDAILSVARFPILAASGVPNLDGNDVTSPDARAGADFHAAGHTIIGPFRVLTSEDPNAKFYYVEHDGKAIQAGERSLAQLEAKMAAYGSEFLKKSPDRETATARALDSAESVSPLQAVTLTFLDAMQRALALTAKWMGQEEGGTVTLITDFGPEEASTVDITALNAARQGRDISLETYLKELVRRGILADDFDVLKNKSQLQKEALDLEATQPPAAKSNLDPTSEPSKKEPDDKPETEE